MVTSGTDVLAVLRGAVVEYAWSSAHLALWPFGFRPAPPAAPDPAVDTEPVLLVHGVIDNRSIFTVLRRSLRRAGIDQVHTTNYSLLTNDVRTAAARLALAVEELCAVTGRPRIRLVGHSLGGLIARYYVQRLGGDERVSTLVTLATPHLGTQLARLVPLRLTRQLRPGSELLTELAGPAAGCRTRMVAVYSRHDEVVIPGQYARLDHPDLNAENIEINAVGHQSMVIDARVLTAVASALGAAVQLTPAPRSPSLCDTEPSVVY
jgi:predicted alpha/beta hydrolase family esterase